MYAVIFSATIKALDNEYFETASQLRELAQQHYGCVEFNAYTEGEKEIAISLWQSQEDILAWRNDPLHVKAQQRGKESWYHDYKVQITQIVREYSAP